MYIESKMGRKDEKKPVENEIDKEEKSRHVGRKRVIEAGRIEETRETQREK